ncbi:MAG TPA: sodium:calcium symporter, partial [Candidatus Synoicihabitans sp.]|nr:sodium:calcium symporter [Candidatus Synoicihabitans sp.]
FGWGLGIRRGWEIAHEGAEMKIPSIYKFGIKWVTPAFLLTIFVLFILNNVLGWNFSFADAKFDPTGYVDDLVGENPNAVARATIGFIVVLVAFSLVFVNIGGKKWNRRQTDATARAANPAADI